MEEKRLPPGNCPYCDITPRPWGLSPKGWESMKRDHDAGHPRHSMSLETQVSSRPPQEKLNGCCERCSKSKFALKGKVKEKFGGICGLACECHISRQATGISMQPTPPQAEGWEEEFELFRQTNLWDKVNKKEFFALKDFISSLLQKEREEADGLARSDEAERCEIHCKQARLAALAEVREAAEKMKVDMPDHECSNDWCSHYPRTDATNETIRDILGLLTTLANEKNV